MVRDILSAVALKIPRPCLVVSSADETLLRLPQNQKIPRRRDVSLGGPYRIRTGDLLIANEALYQLS